MKKIILYFSVIASIISCREREVETIVVGTRVSLVDDASKKEIPFLLKQIKDEQANKTIDFQYDGDKIKEISDGRDGGKKITFTYSNGLINTITDEKNNTTTYEYMDGKVSKSVLTYRSSDFLHGASSVIVTKTYIYNEDEVTVNLRREEVYADGQKREFNNDAFYTATLKDGKVVEITQKDIYNRNNAKNAITVTIDNFEYDDKNSPLKNIKGIKNIGIALYDEKILNNLVSIFSNNFLKKGVSISDGKVYPIGSTENTYDYNTKNYPTKLISKVSEDDIKTENTYTFKYNQ